MTQNQKEIVEVHGLVNSSVTQHSRLPRIVLLFLVLSLYNSFSLPPFSCLSHFLSYVLPLLAPHTFSPPFSFFLSLPHYFLLLPPVYLLPLAFPFWVLVYFSPILPSLMYLFDISFSLSIYCSLFLLFCQLFYLHFSRAIFCQYLSSMLLLLLKCENLNLSCALGFPKCQSSSTERNWCLALMSTKGDTAKASLTVALVNTLWLVSQAYSHSWIQSLSG